jgi:hypothetical protein
VWASLHVRSDKRCRKKHVSPPYVPRAGPRSRDAELKRHIGDFPARDLPVIGSSKGRTKELSNRSRGAWAQVVQRGSAHFCSSPPVRPRGSRPQCAIVGWSERLFPNALNPITCAKVIQVLLVCRPAGTDNHCQRRQEHRFSSEWSGTSDTWVSAADGSHPLKLTDRYLRSAALVSRRSVDRV